MAKKISNQTSTQIIITPEEQHRMLLELAFFILPIDLTQDVSALSFSCGFTQTKFRAFIRQMFDTQVLTPVRMSGMYYKDYYALSFDQQFELLREVRQNPKLFLMRSYSKPFQMQVQRYVVDNLVRPVTIYSTESEFCYRFLKMVPFYEDFRPFFDNQSSDVQYQCFAALSNNNGLLSLPKTFDLKAAYLENPAVPDFVRKAFKSYIYKAYYVLAARFNEMDPEVLNSGTFYAMMVCGVIALYKGDFAASIKLFQACLKALKQKSFPEAFYNVCYVVALMREGSPSSMKAIASFQRIREVRQNYALKMLLDIASETRIENQTSKYYKAQMTYMSEELKAIYMIIGQHFGVKNFEVFDKELCSLIHKPEYLLLQLEASASSPFFKKKADDLKQMVGFAPMLPTVEHKEEWEQVLDRLLKIQTASKSDEEEPLSVETSSTVRIVYRVTPYGSISPVLQKSKDGVHWSAGRNISLKKFVNGLREMSDFDLSIMPYVKRESRGWSGTDYYELGGPEAMAALAGHPLVFAESCPNTPVVITREKLQLTVTKTQKGFRVEDNLNNIVNPYSLEISDADEYTSYRRLMLTSENDFLFHVVELTNQQIEMLPILHSITTFPLESAPRLTELLNGLSKTITIHSDLVASNTNAESIEADSRLTVQLQPLGEGIMAETYVKPLTGNPPYCKPGMGNISVMGTVEGRLVQTQRDLKAEKVRLKQLEEWWAPVIGQADSSSGDYYYFSNPATCLSLLEVLQAHQDEVLVEWPKGEQFSLHGKVDFKDIRLKSKGAGQWFELEGDVMVDDREVMSVSDLLHKLRESNSRFIQLSDGEFVALSERLRSQLSALEAITQSNKTGNRIPAIAAGFLSGLEGAGVTVKKDKALRDLQRRIAEAERKEFAVPEGINAELRDYQVTGYQWMARLSEWGAGACLADDMGLGKTLQTITLLLARAPKGPSLVVAPTSVQLNWVSELRRFAPTLNPVVINDQRGERQALIEQAQPFDVVLTTYGVLAKESEALAARAWNVIALDEAHTIKNKETKMSKAAMELRGDARVLLTGTPLQNNLSELWTLFQFANPGLLGDFQSFTTRFLNPIEKQDDVELHRLLKRMVSPFILRRTKSEVLDELPEKTEITLRVELSSREQALYESLRRAAIANMSDGQNNAIQALAEITKLRQAACNPSLINPELHIPSSKTAAFCELVGELVRNHHRALVFSQFTSHLSLIREALDKSGIEYLYLDGSTTSAARTKLVKQFQEGSTPLFLISLKAGGLGLNLTAADYVIHLDPWWNPAIEDQASDRAYRMGQTRAVTVYRLIAAGTIEEKIIRLHQTKKSLADSLLEGSNKIQKISAAEILQLLTEK